MKTIVIGGGIIGASIAWHVSQAAPGSDCVVIDAGGPAATGASFGWINASFYADAAHHRLRVASLEAYERMRGEVQDIPVIPSGALWWEEQGAGLAAMQDALDALSYPVNHRHGDALAQAEPDVLTLPDAALEFPSESATDAAALAEVLLRASGARVLHGVAAQGILADSRVTGVDTSVGRLEADRVVVAAGTGAPAILDTVGVRLPMVTRPGVLVTTPAVNARLNRILVTPFGEVRQLPDGRILASAVANHQGDDACDVTETAFEIAERVLRWLDPMIRGGVSGWDKVSLAHRPVPQDGLPVIGPAGPEGLHIAVMHSGVTLAAIAGQVTAAEVLGRASTLQTDLVAPYRPERFQ